MENFDTGKIIKYAGESKQQVIDSRDVARMIGKTHRHLMRDIRGYINEEFRTVQNWTLLNSSLNQAISHLKTKNFLAIC